MNHEKMSVGLAKGCPVHGGGCLVLMISSPGETLATQIHMASSAVKDLRDALAEFVEGGPRIVLPGQQELKLLKQ